MQKFNATNVVLNSIRLATPSVKVAGGEGGSLAKFAQKTAICRRKVLCARKMPKYPGLRCSS